MLASAATHVPRGARMSHRPLSSPTPFSPLRRLLALTALSAGMASSATSASAAPQAPVEYFRKDYQPSPFVIPQMHLSFQLAADETLVTTTSTIAANPNIGPNPNLPPLTLDGEDSIELLSVSIDGTPLAPSQYSVVDSKLVIAPQHLPEGAQTAGKSFALTTTARLRPDKNLALSGLYSSGPALLCTQCEAMGFRRLAFSLDRPDVLTRYTVRLEASKEAYPVLLSNGNKVDGGDLPGNRHFALWEDPFPKPSYLFALVAGDLGSIHSTFRTSSGRQVQLGIYSDKENAGKLAHAMYSIKVFL